jgi:hypothetical protein
VGELVVKLQDDVSVRTSIIKTLFIGTILAHRRKDNREAEMMLHCYGGIHSVNKILNSDQ